MLVDQNSGMLEIVVSFFACVCMLLALLQPARKIGLVDRPGARKLHKYPVPLVGGIGIALTILIFHILWFFKLSAQIQYVLLLGYFIMCVGVFDDRWPLGSLIRLLLQVVIVLGTILLSGLYVDKLDTILVPDMPLALGGLGVLFTIFCITGVINASNMIDGVDGLLGVVCSITVLAIGTLALIGQVHDVASLAYGLLGTLMAFLLFNLGVFGKKRRVFLGDAGSTYVGFLIGFLLIILSESDSVVISTASAGWLFGFPLMDSVSVIVRRLTQKRSALLASNDHFHHRLLESGFSSSQTLVVVACMHAVFVAVGVFANLVAIPGYVLFYGFVVLTVLFHFKVDSLIRFLLVIPAAKVSESPTAARPSPAD